jgi:hypothetical protein
MKTLSPALAFPVSIPEAKHQLGYFHSEDDAQVAGLIVTATREAEHYTGVISLFRTVKETFSNWPAGEIVLAGLPFAKLDTVQYYDAAETLQTLSPSLYRLYNHELNAEIEIKETWPDLFDRKDAVQVTYRVGHAGLTTATQATDLFNQPNHPFVEGDMVLVYGANESILPVGITARQMYHIVEATANTFKLSSTSGGSAIDITSDGSGAFYVGFAEVNPQMKAAILMMISGLNEFRSDEITGTMISRVTMGSRHLLNQVKPYLL